MEEKETSYSVLIEMIRENHLPTHSRKFLIPNHLITDKERSMILSQIHLLDGDLYERLIVDALHFRLYPFEYKKKHELLFVNRKQFQEWNPELYHSEDEHKWKDFEIEIKKKDPSPLPDSPRVTHIYHVYEGFTVYKAEDIVRTNFLRDMKNNGPASQVDTDVHKEMFTHKPTESQESLIPKEKRPFTCFWCLQTFPEQIKSCSRCANAYYCSTKCQKFDWKTHKQKCTNIY